MSLFPTTLWLFQIPPEVHNRVNSLLRDRFDRLIAAAPGQADDGGWQTEHDLHTLPEMQELTGWFMAAVHEVLGVLSTKPRDVQITGCWANISPPGGTHDSHMHPNNFLSAAYYVNVPKGGHRITFWDPRHQIHILAPPVEHFNVHNSDYTNLEVEEGMLVLFPAWLVHSVPVNAGNEDRISISFNINFTDFTERVSPPTWTPNLPIHPKASGT
ncbi:MAG: 2OG-Fe(II) oxygenase family protein [Alphaproteobacteria bacterium]|nr:2OG-Fe(II) oxygenase family protein [Alphaproteobacteria bacterium]